MQRCGLSADIAKVDIGVAGGLVDPDVFTNCTGLVPSRAWTKGEVYLSRSGRQMVRPWGMWAVERQGSNVEQVALELLEMVEAQADRIRKEAGRVNGTVSVAIWWEPEGGFGGFTVSADVMKRLSALGERIDVYFPGHRE